MKTPSKPDNEKKRLSELRGLNILDTEGEERFDRIARAALNAAANGIMITDSSGIIEWVNPAFTHLTGFSFEDAVGHKSNLLRSGRQDPAYYKELWETIKSGSVWHGELFNRRKEGKHYLEEMTITPVCNDQGEIVHFISIKQDITRRKAAENKLQKTLSKLETLYDQSEEAKSQIHAILNAASEAMVLISKEESFLAINRQFENFFSVREKNIIGRPFAELLPSFERIFEDPEGIKSRLDDAINAGETKSVEVVVQKWPQRRELEIYSKKVKIAHGKLLGMLYVFRDVTLEREVDRMKSEFVSLVSHELRTPLTSIIGYVDLLLEGDAGKLEEDQMDFLETVKRNACRLSQLVGDLLDVSRIESGSVKIKREAVDLVELISGVAKSLQPQFESKQQVLTLDLKTGHLCVDGDLNRLIQVITNLLSNANKYTKNEGEITVKGIGENDNVRIEVTDNGIGLSEEEQKRLFTKFYRAENQFTQDVSGTGLGLWITRSIIEMHGGTITVSSVPGEGSTFCVTLPISRNERDNGGRFRI